VNNVTYFQSYVTLFHVDIRIFALFILSQELGSGLIGEFDRFHFVRLGEYRGGQLAMFEDPSVPTTSH
jgi:hypothetical protein